MGSNRYLAVRFDFNFFPVKFFKCWQFAFASQQGCLPSSTEIIKEGLLNNIIIMHEYDQEYINY